MGAHLTRGAPDIQMWLCGENVPTYFTTEPRGKIINMDFQFETFLTVICYYVSRVGQSSLYSVDLK